MTIHYPNGVKFQPQSDNHSGHVKPSLIKHGGRGMTLEQEINESNQYYLSHDIAVIHKKPTPVQIVKVDYPKRSAAVIREAYFRQASTTDYNGVYRGRYIDFDAKETKETTRFPLDNFHQHQVEHMRSCLKQGGICFGLIKFVTLDQLYLLKATDLITYWDAQEQAKGRKSIPLAVFESRAVPIKYSLNPTIAYLDAVDQII
ncbi:Holliday junction resolvase RecU [Secundilactobacillus sp. HBUAS58055]|uniref:Holliday junction resolvase RecU n=1 Tax=Secundilactobacillus angelensis TaxID=2722706 RepID=UPI001F0DB8A4|nr:Holliday junction resolvase RecU [Secundilactobacillus angelensis]